MARPLAARVVAALVLLASAGPTRAAEVEVGPVLVTLTPATRNALVTIRNQGKEASRFEIQAKAWNQGPAGEMELSSTEEIAVYPPVLVVAPGEERNIRVGAVTPPGAVERSYRVIVQEMAPPETPESGAQVRLLTRMLLPIFVAPAKGVEKPVIAGLAARAGQVTFRLANEGTVHIRPESVKLVGTGAAGEVVFESELPAWYVLAGGVREYVARIPKEACAALRSFVVSVDLSREVLRSRLDAPAPCSP
jgi:fimbrial chaperone protein